ncbi:MAG: hypothetical protein EPO21_16760 [Chloroflexota bacterium]|nr:MAG: hypothetical protein EPO21_16760 [Chloroflexota bacterium]
MAKGQLLVGMSILALLMLYVVALDQGLLLSLVQGNLAFDQNLLHEITHDARHAAGFPCH